MGNLDEALATALWAGASAARRRCRCVSCPSGIHSYCWVVGSCPTCACRVPVTCAVQLVTKTVTEQKQDKDYAKRVQEYYDKYKERKKKVGLKS